MTDYVIIADEEIEPEAPIISSLGVRFRDNAIAIAEGSDGAPRIAWRALQRLYLGTIALDGTGTGVNNLDQAENITLLGAVGSVPADPEVRYSNDNGSSYGSWQRMLGSGDTADANGVLLLQLNLRTGAHVVITTNDDSTTGSHTVPSDANAFQVRSAGAAGGRFLVFVTGGVQP